MPGLFLALPFKAMDKPDDMRWQQIFGFLSAMIAAKVFHSLHISEKSAFSDFSVMLQVKVVIR